MRYNMCVDVGRLGYTVMCNLLYAIIISITRMRYRVYTIGVIVHVCNVVSI